MDADAPKSLGTLLLWGGFFFLMMRYGCGAHMMGGHGNHGNAASGVVIKDRVCGMVVNPKSAAAAAVRDGNTYYFCSTACCDKFEQTPQKYLSAYPREVPQIGGHHHG